MAGNNTQFSESIILHESGAEDISSTGEASADYAETDSHSLGATGCSFSA
jgi:hypothetical protein